MNDKAPNIATRCAYCGSNSNPLEVQELQRTLATRDKLIALLRRRLDGAPLSASLTPGPAGARAVALENIVARKTAELERQRFELEKVLFELRTTRQRLHEALERNGKPA